jgi:hypothetical protein
LLVELEVLAVVEVVFAEDLLEAELAVAVGGRAVEGYRPASWWAAASTAIPCFSILFSQKE